MKEKYQWIDSLKGIAICGVVMIHSGVSNLPFPLGRLGAGGAYGVYIFLCYQLYWHISQWTILWKVGKLLHPNALDGGNINL